MHRFLVLSFVFAISIILGVRAEAATPEATQQAAEKLFTLKVLPLLKSKCLGCHGDKPDDLKGQLDLTSRAGLLRGGESEEASIVPGHPQRSSLIQAVKWEGLEMPPKQNDRLTAAQIEVLHDWIAQGAPWPDQQAQSRYRKAEWSRTVTDEGVLVTTSGGLSDEWTYRRYQPEDLWAYRPIPRPAVPEVALDGDRRALAIDAFIQRKLTAKQLNLAPPADRRTLIRRVTYDLIGLPPSPEEVAAFVRDDAPDAYERLVDRLLASPRYGEQWARHWLDVTRYGDTSGFSRDDPRPNAWRYRDYVIRSMNADKPFDRFIIEQIAGDEIDDGDSESLIAVGFLRMGPWEHTGMSVAAVTRQQYLDDATNAIGETFLAHVLRCAKCHDHKFDPIPTRDYYRIMAALAPVQLAERSVAFLAEENTAEFESQKARLQRLLQEARRAQNAIGRKTKQAQVEWLAKRGVKATPENAAAKIKRLPEDQRPPRYHGLSFTELGVQKVLRKRSEYLERMLLTYEPHALSVYSGPYRQYSSHRTLTGRPAKLSGNVETIHILQGGSIESPSAAVSPGVLSAALVSAADERSAGSSSLPATTDGRRRALAAWIASEKNPFTARVLVNRIWQQHFGGKGLVRTPNNFGVTGQKPSHPELLDYLATWFMDNGWSPKKLHRLIVMSDTYRRSGEHPQLKDVLRIDPNNELLAYFPPRRLAAEELRDSMLKISGELSLTMGGPGVYPEINREVALQPIHVMGSVAPAWQPSPRREQRNRRTIYAYRQRSRSYPFMEVFNRPRSDTSCERRDETTVSPQAFTLLNSQNSYDRALAMAQRLERMAREPAERIHKAFYLVYGRPPTEAQVAASLAHFEKMANHHRRNVPEPQVRPRSVARNMVEEMTGESFSWTEQLDVYASKDFQPDTKPWDVGPQTRALAEVCLVLLNSNEFLYLY